MMTPEPKLPEIGEVVRVRVPDSKGYRTVVVTGRGRSTLYKEPYFWTGDIYGASRFYFVSDLVPLEGAPEVKVETKPEPKPEAVEPAPQIPPVSEKVWGRSDLPPVGESILVKWNGMKHRVQVLGHGVSTISFAAQGLAVSCDAHEPTCALCMRATWFSPKDWIREEATAQPEPKPEPKPATKAEKQRPYAKDNSWWTQWVAQQGGYVPI